MNQCQRGCCWSPWAGVCAQRFKCACHRPTLHEWISAPTKDHSRTDYPDPTAAQAVRNVMRARNKK